MNEQYGTSWGYHEYIPRVMGHENVKGLSRIAGKANTSGTPPATAVALHIQGDPTSRRIRYTMCGGVTLEQTHDLEPPQHEYPCCCGDEGDGNTGFQEIDKVQW